MIPSQTITLLNTRLLGLSDFGLWEFAGYLLFIYLANARQVNLKVFICATLLIYLPSWVHALIAFKTVIAVCQFC